jgi:hypothetical protein
VRKLFLGVIVRLFTLHFATVETSFCLILSSPHSTLEFFGGSFSLLVYIHFIFLSTSVPGVGAAYFGAVSCAISAILIIIIVGKSSSFVHLPALSDLLATRQVLLFYLLFIIAINEKLAGACGWGVRSRRIAHRRSSSLTAVAHLFHFLPKGKNLLSQFLIFYKGRIWKF